MKLQELKALLAEMGVRPSRKLGQNFLIDPNTIERICRCSPVEAGDFIVEIGPGTGAMTDRLLDRGVEITAIEYDARLAEYLTEKYSNHTKVNIVQADAGRVDMDALVQGRRWACNANLPYSVSTVILAKIARQNNLPVSMTLLLQREMAERIAAPPGNKSYGALSVRLQALFDVEVAGIVKPTVFWPQPDVDSAILTLSLKDKHMPQDAYIKFDAFVKHAFAQRRKKLMKRLKHLAPSETLERAFTTIGISNNARPEDLSVPQFIDLFHAIDRPSR